MPYLNVKIATSPSKHTTNKIVSTLVDLTSEILGKKKEVMSIAVEYVQSDLWFAGDATIKSQKAVTFYFEIKITEGTNTKDEKAQYIEKVFASFENILGKIEPASYIVIQDVGADSWGFQGKTQESRYIEAKSI